MRLTELRPKFYSTGGEGITNSLTGEPVPLRTGVGLICDCPCGCGSKMAVPFHNPLDGGPACVEAGKSGWTREGETFDTLTLSPSIKRIPHAGSCGWHGFIKAGEIESCNDSLPASAEFLAAMKELGIEID